MFKRLIVGRPVSTYQELEHRVPKRIALAVFSSDALSSSAYATDVMMVVLAAAGAGALSNSIPIAIAVASVLMVVVLSYRMVVHAYPHGGGGYEVTTDNLGVKPAVVVASSLLIDYVLTLAVSVAAGVKALGAAVPAIQQNRIVIALGVVVLITLANLRGVKEAGPAFAVPTYGFLLTMGAMIVIGSVRALSPGFEAPPSPDIQPMQAVTVFLILHAFSSGATALTGVEAIANTVPTFRPPESRNAAATLMTLGILLTFLFLGITFLANVYGADPHLSEQAGKPIPSQIAAAIFGAGAPMFVAVQFFTALILFLAANTAYAGFPSLASVLARDRILPRALKNRGDKLAYSNGILILAAVAALVLVVYDADELQIIPLYVIGVFTNFTLSQSGLVRKWVREKSERWRSKVLMNGFGAATTAVVLVIVSWTKFTDGAWQVIILIPALAYLLHLIHSYYLGVERELHSDKEVHPVKSNRAVVLVSPYVGATVKALGFARALVPDELHAVAFRVTERVLRRTREAWKRLGIDLPIEATGHSIKDLVEYVRGIGPTPENPVTVVIPDPQSPNPIKQVQRGRTLLRVKGAFLTEPSVVVVSVPFGPDDEPEPERVRAPGRLSIIVLVSAVHRATLGAIQYARALNPSELKGVTISADPEEGAKVLRDWEEARIDIPLEIVDSPFRSIIGPLRNEIRALRPSPNDAVAVIIPEFITAKLWQELLHGQTALLVKTALLFEPNVVVIDVPYRIRSAEKMREDQAEQAG
jgi:amino acid transporter